MDYAQISWDFVGIFVMLRNVFVGWSPNFLGISGFRWIIARLVLESVLVIQAPLFPLLFSSVCPSSVRLFDLGSGLPVEPVQGSYTGVQSSPVHKVKQRWG